MIRFREPKMFLHLENQKYDSRCRKPKIAFTYREPKIGFYLEN